MVPLANFFRVLINMGLKGLLDLINVNCFHTIMIFCVIVSQKSVGSTSVTRQCKTGTMGVSTCVSGNFLFGISGAACSCSTDLCNSAPAAMLPSAAALIIVALMMLRNLLL
jgi:hypothetical protein